MKKLFVLVIGAALSLAGCASTRGVDVGSDPAYAIEVVNQRSGAVTIIYNDGTSDRQLGTVAAGRTERFVVVSPQRTNITVSARTSAGANVGTYPVTLWAGSTQQIVVR